MLILKKKISPKRRWSAIYFEPSLSKIKKKLYFKINNISLKCKKKKINIRFYNINKKLILKAVSYSVVQDYITNKFYKKEYISLVNIYNNVSLLTSSCVFFPGFLYLNYALNKLKKNIQNYIGHFIELRLIPINSIVSNIYNKTNNKITYSKSPGCNSIKKKYVKKSKLIYVKLPSTKVIILSENTFALFSKTFSKNNKSTAGGWGNVINRLKKVNVRGVAKNPVDHPNGGRTKSKQPEMSPWGWVAKLNK